MATATQFDLGARDTKIEGDFGSVGLNDLLQMMGMARRTGTIRVTYEGREGTITCKEGEVLHAVAGSATGEEALARLVRWTDAKFSIEEGVEDDVATIAKSADAAVLEVLRRMDEGEEPDVLFTPFPPLDRPDPDELADIARQVRAAKLKPRRAHKTSSPTPRRAAILAGVVLSIAAAGAYFYTQSLEAFPSLPPFETNAPSVRTESADALSSAVANGTIDAPSLLAGYGVRWVAESKPSAEPTLAVGAAPAAASPATATAATMGRLLVLVEPWAKVRLDGVDIGETPLAELSVEAGTHDIVLSNPDRIGVIRKTVTVEAGASSTFRYSFDDKGSLRVIASPWADVYVDGEHVGQTPMADLELPVGSHTVRFTHPDLGEKTKVIDVHAGAPASLKVEMQ